jgi:hypothetical protein
MIENFNIKIVRMKSGEDIIAFVFEDYKNKKIHLKFPKTFYFNYDTDTEEEDLVLVDWMTRKAFAYQEVYFSMDEILFTTYSSIMFGYEYLDALLQNMDPTSELAAKIQESIDGIKSGSDLDIPDDTTMH